MPSTVSRLSIVSKNLRITILLLILELEFGSRGILDQRGGSTGAISYRFTSSMVTERTLERCPNARAAPLEGNHGSVSETFQARPLREDGSSLPRILSIIVKSEQRASSVGTGAVDITDFSRILALVHGLDTVETETTTAGSDLS
jgi:hypothetical protein